MSSAMDHEVSAGPRHDWWAYFCCAAAMCLVGSMVVAGKILVTRLPIGVASVGRFVVACLVLWPLLARRQGLRLPSAPDLKALFLQAFTGTFLFSVFLLHGLKATSATAAGLITASTPALVGVLAWLMLGERLGATQGLGLLCSVAGLMLINLAGAAGGVSGLLGNTLVLAAAVCEALFTIFRKRQSAAVSPLAAAFWCCLWGLILFLPMALAEAPTFNWAGLGWPDLALILYFGLMVSAAAFLLWFAGVARIPASRAAAFTAFWPLSAVVLSWLVLGEQPHPAHLAGGGAVLLGLWLTTRPGRAARAARAGVVGQG